MVELLLTISLITIIALIKTLVFGRIRKDALSSEYDNIKSLIETKTAKYSSESGVTAFYVEELIEKGYAGYDDENPILDYSLINTDNEYYDVYADELSGKSRTHS